MRYGATSIVLNSSQLQSIHVLTQYLDLGRKEFSDKTSLSRTTVGKILGEFEGASLDAGTVVKIVACLRKELNEKQKLAETPRAILMALEYLEQSLLGPSPKAKSEKTPESDKPEKEDTAFNPAFRTRDQSVSNQIHQIRVSLKKCLSQLNDDNSADAYFDKLDLIALLNQTLVILGENVKNPPRRFVQKVPEETISISERLRRTAEASENLKKTLNNISIFTKKFLELAKSFSNGEF